MPSGVPNEFGLIEVTAADLPPGVPACMLEGVNAIYYVPSAKGYTLIRRVEPTEAQRKHMVKTLNEFGLRSTARKMGYDPDKCNLSWAPE